MRRGLATMLGVAVSLSLLPVGTASAGMSSPTVEGTLYRLASDNGAFERSDEPQWVLETDDGRVLPVADAAGLESGTRLGFSRISKKNGSVTAASLRSASLLAGPPGRSRLRPNRRLIVVPLQWGGSTWSAEDAANAQDIINLLTPWWTRMSAGRETLNARVIPALDGNAKFPASCDPDGFLTAAEKYVEGLGISNDAFDNIMVTFPGTAPRCGWAGLGYVGGGGTWTYTLKNYAKVWAHELGHNLGFPHANLCRSEVTVSYLRACDDAEYGNNMDIMGSSNSPDLVNAYYSPTFLRAAQWLPDDKMSVWAGASATYTIFKADSTDLGQTAVSIPATDTAAGDNPFWLQYNPTARDSYAPRVTAPNGGVVITMEPSEQFAAKRVRSGKGTFGFANSTSYLCDITPEIDFNRVDPRLLPGGTFTDPRNRFTVTVLSADGTKAEVRIDPVAQVTVTPPVRVTAVADADGGRKLNIAVDASTGGANEPTRFVIDIAEDPSRTCTVDVWTPACTLTDLVRNVPYTVRAVSTNGPARSAVVQATTLVIPSVPPAFDVTVTPLPTSLVATVKVDDGGSPLTSPPTLEIPGRAPCSLDPSAETTCTFDGLNPRSTYVLTARGTNAVGLREKQYSARTLVNKPLTPKLSAVLEGTDVVVTATAEKVDAVNVTHMAFDCLVGRDYRTPDPVPIDPVSLSASERVTGARGKETWCWVTAIASDDTGEGDGGYATSDRATVNVTARGKVTVVRVLLKVSVTSRRKGTVLVRWQVTGATKKSFVDVRTSRHKPCLRLSPQSCVVRGLKSKSKFTVVVSVFGGMSNVADRQTVVVR